MYPGAHARSTPEKAAAIDAVTGATLTYRDLDQRSTQLARLWRAHGLRRGDHVALLMENNLCFFEVAWAALRSGLYITTINRYLPPDEAAYIINDCGARAMVTSHAMRETASALPPLMPDCTVRLMTDGVMDGWMPYETAIAEQPTAPLAQQPMGAAMLYSSGTTGRPKGIKRPLPDHEVSGGARSSERLMAFGFHADTRVAYARPTPSETSGVSSLSTRPRMSY